MKILWVSDNPAGKSGYAGQTAIFAPRIQAHGHELTIFANNLQGEPINWRGIKVLPRFNDRAGNDLFLQHARHFAPEGLTFVLHDIWVYDPTVLGKTGNVAAWTPVDHEPLQFVTDDTLRKAGAFSEPPRIYPVAMTRHAQESFSKAGYDAPYVPHAFDGTIYGPRDRKESRALIGVPEDAFLVGVVGDNQGIAPPRKAWPELLMAFAKFRKAKRDAALMMHTDMLGVRGGLDLFQIIRDLDIPKEALFIVDPYLYRISAFSPAYMSHLYSAFDTLLMPSYGEGFGVCGLEANACGTPVISNDFSAMKEVSYGWHVSGSPWWTALGGWQSRPDVDDIVSKLHAAYSKAESKRQASVEHASPYEATKVTNDYMMPALKELAARFGIDE